MPNQFSNVPDMQLTSQWIKEEATGMAVSSYPDKLYIDAVMLWSSPSCGESPKGQFLAEKQRIDLRNKKNTPAIW